MAEFFHALSAVFLIFCLMAVGYVCGCLKWMGASEKKFISRFIMNIALPMNCISGILNNVKREDLSGMASMLSVPLATVLVMLVISWAAAKALKLPRNREGVFIAMSFLSNTLFIGLPMSTQLFGEVSVPYVMAYWMVSTCFTQSVALLLVEHAGEGGGGAFSPVTFLKDIVTKPPIIALVLAYLMLWFGFRPPELFMSFAKYMSQTVTPLALLYSGFIMYELGLKNVRFEKGLPAMLVLRLLVSPLLCLLFCLIFKVEGLAKSVFIVESALPVVTQITVMAGHYRADEKYSAAGSTLSMFGIFITIPVIMVLLP
ncbi:MAG: AEC family transporter [Stomatobaculum sp.]|nr:AEC family transporter [Stomatobaculum sp.]